MFIVNTLASFKHQYETLDIYASYCPLKVVFMSYSTTSVEITRSNVKVVTSLSLFFFALREYLSCFYGFKYCSGCLNGVSCFLAYTNFVYILRDQNNIYIVYVICGTINPYLRSIRDRLPCYDVEITRVSVVILKLDGENNV